MLHCRIKYIFNVLIAERIENRLAVPACAHEPCLLQNAKLVRYRRLCHAETVSNIAHAKFALAEHKNYPDPCGVSKDFQKFRRIKKRVLIRSKSCYLLSYIVFRFMRTAIAIMFCHIYTSHIAANAQTASAVRIIPETKPAAVVAQANLSNTNLRLRSIRTV